MRGESSISVTDEDHPLLTSDAQIMATPISTTSGRGFGWRHGITFLGFLGFFMVYVLRVNLSVGLVAMLNHTAIGPHAHNSSSSACPADGNSSAAPARDGPFVWDQPSQSLILGSFFWGYIFTQIPGGWVAQRFGAKWVFGLGTLWTAILTLLTPLAAQLGLPYFVVLRVLEGVGEGVTFPAMNALFARWAPPSERSRLPAFCYSGAQIGTVFSFVASGIMCQSDFLGGWPSVFYVFGAGGVVWFILWTALTTSSPENHPFISDAEKAYILSETSKDDAVKVKSSNPPWRAILTSMPVWAVVVSHTSNNWGFYTLLTELPSFLKDILGFDIKSVPTITTSIAVAQERLQNGFISALPSLAQFFVQNVTGFLADAARRRYELRDSTRLRKLLDCSGHLIPGLCLLGAGFVGCDKTAAVALLTASVGFSGLCGGGFLVNHLDIAPQYAGVLFGLSNTVATIPGFLGPTIVGTFTANNNNVGAWRNVFYLTSGIYFFSVVFYAVFGSGKIQSWAVDQLQEDDKLVDDDDDDDKKYNVVT